MRIYFELPTNPTITSQEKGIRTVKGKTFVYTKSEVLALKNLYWSKIKQEMIKNDIEPPRFKKSCVLTLVFGFSTPDKKKWNHFKATKPDYDNLAKTITDVLGDMDFFETGDQQVVCGQVIKIWSDKPFIRIDIKEVEHDVYRI